MTARSWFLPEAPDLVGLLRRQCALAIDGLDAFAAWAAGDADAAPTVKDAEHRGDAAKRELLEALRTAFVTPLEPEDVFALSRDVDRVLSSAREVVAESQVLDCPPDDEIAEMAGRIGEAMRHIDEAISHLGKDRDQAIACADAALTAEKELDAIYYRGMAALLEARDRSTRIGLRELYRRCVRIGDIVVDAAERVVYAVMKQS